MRRPLELLLLITLLPFLPVTQAFGQFQQGQLQFSQQFRLGETIIRVVEPGQLADSVHVWGDINVSGIYVVPRGSKLSQVVSFGRGPTRYLTSETVLDWSQLRIEVTVVNTESRWNESKTFTFRYNEPIPKSMTDYTVKNNDIVMIEVKRKPAFVDWIRVIAPLVSTVATTILIIQNLN